jgi:GntR family transcriptional regulator
MRQQILDGTIPEGEMLPSIRILAKDLRISVITTKRAYEELEKEGCIYPVPGKGFYVAPMDVALVRRAHTAEIETHLREIRKLAAPLGITKEEISDMLDRVFEE